MKSRMGLSICFLLGVLWLVGVKGLSGNNPQNGAAVVLSAPEGRGNRPPNLKRVSIIPLKPNLQSVLAVQTEAEDPDQDVVTYRYRWTVNGELVSEEATLSLTRFKQADAVSVAVIPFDGKIEGVTLEATPVRIANNPPIVSWIAFQPQNPQAGDGIQALVEASDADGDPIFYDYQWSINGQVVEGQDGDRLRAGILRSNDMIFLMVTPKDSYSEGQPKTSAMVAVKNNPPRIVSVPPSEIQDGAFVYQIVSEDPDGDALEYYLLEGPAGMAIDPDSGRLAWQMALLPEGMSEVAVGVNDGKGGKSEQRFTLRTKQ